MMRKCAFCKSEVSLIPNSSDVIEYDCPKCGRVRMTGRTSAYFVNTDEIPDLHLYSGITRYMKEHDEEPILLSSSNIEEILKSDIIPKDIQDQCYLIIEYLKKNSDYPGDIVELRPKVDYPIAFCKNLQEFEFLLASLESQELIESNGEGHSYKLTYAGWDSLNKEKVKENDSKQAFIAMWFDESVKEVYEESIVRAVKECGFEPLRIDMKEHNNKIDDEIIAEIKKSRFVIADFTGNRGGVYFEAGYAIARDIPVIWTCREDCMKEVHFDTRQFNHITWKSKDDLYEKLSKRIRETI